MSKLTVVLIIIFMITAAAAAKKEIPVITFFVGNVQVAQDPSKGYEPAAVGMELAPESIIRTGSASFVEIERGTSHYVVNEKNTILTSDLKSTGEVPSRLTVLKKLFKKVKTFQNTEVIAVRGSENADDVEWVSDKSQPVASGASGDAAIYNEMAGMISAGDYNGAISLYNNNIKKIKGSRSLFEYLAAMAYFSTCRYADAALLFEKCSRESRSPGVRADSLFFAGFSYNNMTDFQKAVTLLSSYMEKYPKASFTAQSLYLRGTGYLRMGNQDRAASDFRAVMDAFTDDPIAKDAETEYQKLKK